MKPVTKALTKLQKEQRKRRLAKKAVINELWCSFVKEGFLANVKDEDYVEGGTSLPDCTDKSFEESIESFGHSLTENGLKRLRLRFYKYKDRKVNQKTSITVHRQTLDKLKAFAKKNGLDGDNYDLVIELLLDPEDELEEYKEEISDLPSALNITDEARLLKAKLRLRGNTYRQLLAQIEYAYHSGWTACQYFTGKRRTIQALEEAQGNFMDKIKGLF